MRRVRPTKKLRLTPEARRERLRGWWRGVALTVVVLALIVVALMTGLIVALGQGPAEVIVPKVVGQTHEQALDTLHAVGLEGKQMAEIHSDSIEVGVVVRQRPDPQMLVKQGRLVELTISRGPKSVKVPSLVGKSVSEAQDFIEKSYLKVGKISRVASGDPIDTVLLQTPSAGQVVSRDSEVRLQVSGGENYGAWTTPGGRRWVFKNLKVVVPVGKELQSLRVVLDDGDEEETVLDELRRPGEVVTLDIRGRRGTQVKIHLEEKKVFQQELR